MNFEHRCTLPVARAVLWQFLMDVPQLATCVPGVEGVTASGNDQYTGRLRVKVGPIHLTLQGVVTIQERDQQQWRLAWPKTRSPLAIRPQTAPGQKPDDRPGESGWRHRPAPVFRGAPQRRCRVAA